MIDSHAAFRLYIKLSIFRHNLFDRDFVHFMSIINHRRRTRNQKCRQRDKKTPEHRNYTSGLHSHPQKLYLS